MNPKVFLDFWQTDAVQNYGGSATATADAQPATSPSADSASLMSEPHASAGPAAPAKAPGGQKPKGPRGIKAIKIVPTDFSIEAYTSRELVAWVVWDDGSPQEEWKGSVFWRSSDDKVLKVDSPDNSGHATAFVFGKGKAKITAAVGTHEGTVNVTPLVPKLGLTAFPLGGKFLVGTRVSLMVAGPPNKSSPLSMVDASNFEWRCNPPGAVTFEKDVGTLHVLGNVTIAGKDPISGGLVNAKFTVVSPGGGAQKVSLMAIVKDFTGQLMKDYEGTAVFHAPGADDVTIRDKIEDGQFEFDNTWLMPTGLFTFTAVNGARAVTMEKHPYELKGNVLTFNLKQATIEGYTVKHSKKSEVINSLKAKGTIGIDYDIGPLKLGAEVSNEHEEKDSEEVEIDWEVKFPDDKFVVV